MAVVQKDAVQSKWTAASGVRKGTGFSVFWKVLGSQ